MLRAFLNRDAAPPLRLQRRRLAATPGAAAAVTHAWAATHDQALPSAAHWAALSEQGVQRSAAISGASRALQGAASSGGSSSGSDPFIAGLRRYLAAHKFGSATTADLWDALSDASGLPGSCVGYLSCEAPHVMIVQISLPRHDQAPS